MKISWIALAMVTVFSTSVFAADSSELGGPIFDRMTAGCEKYADKKAKEALQSHFNMNFWAGGNVGAGSVESAEKALEDYKSFIRSQCENMVAEVLELKLGHAPWQK